MYHADYQKILYPLHFTCSVVEDTAHQITAIGWLNAVHMAGAVSVSLLHVTPLLEVYVVVVPHRELASMALLSIDVRFAANLHERRPQARRFLFMVVHFSPGAMSVALRACARADMRRCRGDSAYPFHHLNKEVVSSPDRCCAPVGPGARQKLL